MLHPASTVNKQKKNKWLQIWDIFALDFQERLFYNKIKKQKEVKQMKFFQTWQGACITDGITGEFFPAQVPGNIQNDYAKAFSWGDVNYADNCKQYEALEDYAWLYRTELIYEQNEGERIFFVTYGIEYEYDILLNHKKLLHHTGMFSKVELDITDELKNGTLLEIYLYPHPKREGADPCRDQADQSCKPAVCYGWDWHPRLLVSGIFDETFIETRTDASITFCEPSYQLSEDFKKADLHFEIDCGETVSISLYSPDGQCIYEGTSHDIHLEDVALWWCNGQGKANLYRYQVRSSRDTIEGHIGFRHIRLGMNGEHAWNYPSEFPKSRSYPPITIELNGRPIFAKGSNWVNPEIFTATITEPLYEEQLQLAKDANMNILRCWGGAIVNKEYFFELCDRLGLMVWQEFPLACNNYVGTPDYLAVLEQEATAIIRRIRRHPCHVLWCGGNELFNGWSKMTDQSLALRLLNKLCYEYDREKPFIPTAPIMGMGHGHYLFYDQESKQSVFELFRQSDNTAYSEFGIPSIAPMEILEKVLPPELIQTPTPDTAWETHMGYNAWTPDSWLCLGIIDELFGKQTCIEDYIEKSTWTQCEGLKCVFEEARRQKPHCSMAINWCYNEPWNNVAGNSLLRYPTLPQPGYYAVRDALRNVMPSARIEHFSYEAGETLCAELWLLNDSDSEVSQTVRVYLEINGQKEPVLTWETGTIPANTNKKGHKIQIELPQNAPTQAIILHLEADCGNSSYKLLLKATKQEEINQHRLNV
ncbi:MAG: hypothetical protein E7397_00800 [Ruminococcaceae bacterium]|nr:hypothetical protein [Oscillospiraceae bacterium]